MKRVVLALCLSIQLLSPTLSAQPPKPRSQFAQACRALMVPVIIPAGVLLAGWTAFAFYDPVEMTNYPPIENAMPLTQIQIIDESVTTPGRGVKGDGTIYQGHGYLIGQVTSSVPDRHFYFLRSLEIEVNQGAFAGTIYQGDAVDFSTEFDPIFQKAQALGRQTKSYIVEYIHKSAFNPEVQNSHLQIIGIYTPEEFLASQGVTSFPKEIVSGDPWNGYRTEGDLGAKQTGRIVDVERYGTIDNFCRVELNRGGTRSGKEALQVFSVVDEDICRFAEIAMAYGEVQVDFAQDRIEYWNPSEFFINNIRILEPSVQQGLDPELKKKLLDPNFLRELRDALEKLPKN